MSTGQVIVNNALTILGILEQGGTPSTSDSNDSLLELNAMWDAWGIDEGLIFAVTELVVPLSNNTGGYTIGLGATINVARPNRVYRAFVGGSVSSRNELEVVESAKYYSHNSLDASAANPDELFPDFNVDPTTGFGKLYLWPVPSFGGSLNLYVNIGSGFIAWVLGTNYNIPQGYQDAIQYALAFRLIPRFAGSVPQEIVQVVTAIAQKAEARIREMNSINRKLPAPQVMTPEAQLAPQQK